MMHRCCSSQCNMMGQCTCGLFRTQTNSFTTLFPMHHNDHYESDHIYPFHSSSSSVDCTLSLGTPSTRLCQDDEKTQSRSTYSSSFCWDILHNKNSNTPYKTTSRTATSINTSDPLLARRCANCDTTSTPLWRNGPRGPKSLCNACGIRFKKEERRATAANGTTTASTEQHFFETGAQKLPCFTDSAGNEFRFIDGSETDSDSSAAIPFLSWRLNVTDRPSLVHHFT